MSWKWSALAGMAMLVAGGGYVQVHAAKTQSAREAALVRGHALVQELAHAQAADPADILRIVSDLRTLYYGWPQQGDPKYLQEVGTSFDALQRCEDEGQPWWLWGRLNTLPARQALGSMEPTTLRDRIKTALMHSPERTKFERAVSEADLDRAVREAYGRMGDDVLRRLRRGNWEFPAAEGIVHVLRGYLDRGGLTPKDLGTDDDELVLLAGRRPLAMERLAMDGK